MALTLILTGMWVLLLLLSYTFIYLAIDAWQVSKAYAIVPIGLTIAALCMGVGITTAILGGN